MTKIDALLQRFQNLNVWRRRGERAPHKPLLILLALGRLQSSDQRLMPFDQIEETLAGLLEEFGPPRTSPHPELPFYHLKNDGVWEIEDRGPLRIRRGSENPPENGTPEVPDRRRISGANLSDLEEPTRGSS